MGELFDKLANYGNSGIYPFHMPGHKRQKTVDFNPYKIDITEIEGFDNLHHAEGVLLEAQKKAAYADNFFLPFNLLAASTFLPPAVLILALNP